MAEGIHNITGQHGAYISGSGVHMSNWRVVNTTLAGVKVQSASTGNQHIKNVSATGLSAKNIGSNMFEIGHVSGTGSISNVVLSGTGHDVYLGLNTKGAVSRLRCTMDLERVATHAACIQGDGAEDFDVHVTAEDVGWDGVLVTATNAKGLRIRPVLRNCNAVHDNRAAIRVTSASANVELYDPVSTNAMSTTAITGATNASPIVVTASAHRLLAGQTAFVSGVAGNTAANGSWLIANPTSTTFELVGSSGNGTYTSGGTVGTPYTLTSKTVTGATNASPIVITANGHGFGVGQPIVISGVTGNTAANGSWSVANPTANTFELSGSTGSGTYLSGGAAETPYTKSISGATNAAPIVVTATAHGFAAGQTVLITGVTGNTAANGSWLVANPTTNTFELTGSTGNSAYVSGGLAGAPYPIYGIFNESTGSDIKVRGSVRIENTSSAAVRATGTISEWPTDVAMVGNTSEFISPQNVYSSQIAKLSSTSTTDVAVWSCTLQDGSAVAVTAQITGQKSDGTQRKTWTQTVLVRTAGGTATIEGTAQDHYTPIASGSFTGVISWAVAGNAIRLNANSGAMGITYNWTVQTSLCRVG